MNCIDGSTAGKQNRAQGIVCVGWDEGAFIYETSKQRSTTVKTRKGSNATQDEKEGGGLGMVRRNREEEESGRNTKRKQEI